MNADSSATRHCKDSSRWRSRTGSSQRGRTPRQGFESPGSGWSVHSVSKATQTWDNRACVCVLQAKHYNGMWSRPCLSQPRAYVENIHSNRALVLEFLGRCSPHGVASRGGVVDSDKVPPIAHDAINHALPHVLVAAWHTAVVEGLVVLERACARGVVNGLWSAIKRMV